MEEKKSNSSGALVVGIGFLVGLGIALGIGWGVFPSLLFSKEKPEVNFPHAMHMDMSCEDCHYFRDDGSYSGAPGISNCRQCHEEMMTESEDERILVEEYIQQDKEIQWKVYAWQPDNVYFSHNAHVGEDVQCTRCHRDVVDEMQMPVYQENRLTGYSRSTMKMVECEKCHAENGASNACHICHK